MVKPRRTGDSSGRPRWRIRRGHVLLLGVFLAALAYIILLTRYAYQGFPDDEKVMNYSDERYEKDRAEALAYVRSIKSFDRTLKFFHIPKTAGTAVEYAAGRHKIPWGSCSFYHKPKRGICPYPTGGTWPEHVGWWHVPTQFFPILNVNPYADAELFAITRDPYDRMVSEFFYICTLKVLRWRSDQCDRDRLSDPTYMNQWLVAKMKDEQRQESSAAAFLMDNGHFTPQHDFIFGPHQVRMIDYVLQMDDSLSEHFSQLMEAFSLRNLKLEKRNALGASARESDAQLGVEHLNVEATRHIHEIYSNDFSLLGYKKRPVESE